MKNGFIIDENYNKFYYDDNGKLEKIKYNDGTVHGYKQGKLVYIAGPIFNCMTNKKVFELGNSYIEADSLKEFDRKVKLKSFL